MDITHVTHLYRPSIGGIENYVERLMGSLRESGHDVSVVTTDHSLPDGADPPRKPGVTYCKTTASVSRNPVSVDLHRRLRNSDADVYHLHSPYLLPTVEAAHAIPRDATSVVTVHGFPAYDGLGTTIRNLAYRPVAQYVFDRVDGTIVLGESERDRLHDRYDVPDDAVSVIPNGIEPDRCDVTESEVEAFRREYGLDADTPTVLSIGRLVPEKNPDTFVDAVVRELPDRDIQVLVIGSGDPAYVRGLKDRADDRFTFVSGLPWEELLPAYGAADLFVMLSKSEGLSTVILEAMNARLPIVSTPAGGLADVLTHGETGWVVGSPPRHREVGTAIRQYLDNPELARRVGRHNRRYVREAYDWADVARQIESFYGSVGAERRPPARGVAPTIDG